MDYFTLVGLFAVVYLLVYIVVLFTTDCDLALVFADKFGKPLSKLQGKIIWITGASSGIGEALAYEIAQHHGRLVLSGRRISELERVKAKCLEQSGVLQEKDILVLKLDVTKFETHQSCFDQVLKHFGSVDVMINNSGRSQRGIWENTDIDVDREIFNTNVFGVLSLSRIAVKYFEERGKGRLVVTSSLAGIISIPYLGPYCATKHAIRGYFESLRVEKLGQNIQITVLCPGPTVSNLSQDSFTEKRTEKLGLSEDSVTTRMSTERCAHLCLVAIVNKLDEAWMALFPLLPLVYAVTYYPNISKYVVNYLKPRDLREELLRRPSI